MANFDISFSFVVSQEMMLDVNMFGSWVAYGIVCKFYDTFIITQEWDFGKATSEILEGLPHPK
jgi:hypothetical protein